ncbi:hypothetical protein OF83DRAFT_676745 [Amylostereum chailletii]|nr:hypothetical protein OF83DRAFT_676745 [Amylostereum chailletii]
MGAGEGRGELSYKNRCCEYQYTELSTKYSNPRARAGSIETRRRGRVWHGASQKIGPGTI